MNEFDLPGLPELMIEVLEKRNQQSLKEFIDKVDFYLIVDSGAEDLFPDSVFEFILKLMDSEMFLAMQGSSCWMQQSPATGLWSKPCCGKG
jgi:hypothetical protein